MLSLDGNALPLGHAVAPTVLVFWRADCGPCLLELRNAKAYADAAGPGRLLFVGLQATSLLQQPIMTARAPAGLQARTEEAPTDLLARFGGLPPRLPLAVAFDAAGRACAHHSGLLGTEQVRAWVKACGGTHAVGR